MSTNFNFDLVEDLKGIAEDSFAIRDDIGAKKANVWFYEKKGENDPVWKQILPTPNIVDLSHNVQLMEGGTVESGDLFLRSIPISKFNEEDLETVVENEMDQKYWVIAPPNGFTRAYTSVHIKRNYLSFEVHIRRYKSINDNELQPPPPP